MKLRHGLAALLALAGIAAGLWQLQQTRADLHLERLRLGGIPVTVFRPAAGPAGPVVVIAHGFAGSQQLMQPFAETLAHNGYTAVTFDFPGHGRNLEPMPGMRASEAARAGALQGALARVMRFALGLPGADGRLALLGHSMASDIVVRAAEAEPAVVATVAVSMFSPAVTARAPRNLLVIDGALEPPMLTDEARRVVGMAAGGTALPGRTYGSFADGTARRFVLAGGVEHIGVLFSAQALRAALDWLNAAYGRTSSGAVDARGPALGLLYGGLLLLAWPLAQLLPRGTRDPAAPGWRRVWPALLIPPVLTPLLLWRLPTDFMPLLLGDYLTVHFAVYGALTLLLLRLRGVPLPLPARPRATLAAALAVAAYEILALGLPLDTYVDSFIPTGERLALAPVVLVGTLVWFAADAWATRGARLAYAASKLLLLASLLLAVALNPQRLFFLVIIVPVMLIFLAIYGLFGALAYRRTGEPLAGALGNAAALAWAIAATFPLVH
jgi:dienelactone hydrolase